MFFFCITHLSSFSCEYKLLYITNTADNNIWGQVFVQTWVFISLGWVSRGGTMGCRVCACFTLEDFSRSTMVPVDQESGGQDVLVVGKLAEASGKWIRILVSGACEPSCKEDSKVWSLRRKEHIPHICNRCVRSTMKKFHIHSQVQRWHRVPPSLHFLGAAVIICMLALTPLHLFLFRFN